MSVPNWGLLAKSQEDNETIEQAIARLIAVHEADETSHLGTGESLQSHKASEIIDHAARSIVFDKLTADQLIYSTSFENENAFTTIGTPDFVFPGFNLHPNTTTFANRSEVYIQAEDRGLLYDTSKAMIFQFSFSGVTLSGGDFRFMAGGFVNTNANKGLGLEMVDGVARFFFAEIDGSNITYLSWPGFVADDQYIVRIEYDPVTEKAYFYINNVLLGDLDCPDANENDPLYIHILAFVDTAGDADVGFSALNFQLLP